MTSTNERKKPGVGGWVKTTDTLLIYAIDKAGIESDKMMLPHVRWVPRWVPQAAGVYRKHLAATGDTTYAGLQLWEFLKQSAPGAK